MKTLNILKRSLKVFYKEMQGPLMPIYKYVESNSWIKKTHYQIQLHVELI